MQRVNQLLLEKCVNRNCAMCTRCMTKEQIGTTWCYSCGEPMVMQKDLPMSHSQIAALTQEKSRSPPAERTSTSTGSAAKTEQGETQRSTDDWCPHGDSTITFGNLTWTQRMREWRKSAYKKKDKRRIRLLTSTNTARQIGQSVSVSWQNPIMLRAAV